MDPPLIKSLLILGWELVVQIPIDYPGLGFTVSNDGALFVVVFQGSHIKIYNVEKGWKLEKNIDKGIDLLSLCIRKFGNGISIRFWDETWCGNSPLKTLFPRIYMLDNDRGCNIASRVSIQDWSYVLRRTVRGGIESAQLSDLQHLIRDVVLSDNNDSWN
ncbi:hypothetical protein CTI12_AA094270 [Artemisia annua]|uniref:RNA-directed DNA polymerase, eukaryota, Reverse transcriptase zinc-binding domain protein n=1 Tax=Artemisia annua TaxID=35608 RepID=A0A2U1PZ78_ARTAN|nr:hypothetical protein CTI12_AA094270 [Artemisia annua]